MRVGFFVVVVVLVRPLCPVIPLLERRNAAESNMHGFCVSVSVWRLVSAIKAGQMDLIQRRIAIKLTQFAAKKLHAKIV